MYDTTCDIYNNMQNLRTDLMLEWWYILFGLFNNIKEMMIYIIITIIFFV